MMELAPEQWLLLVLFCLAAGAGVCFVGYWLDRFDKRVTSWSKAVDAWSDEKLGKP